MGRSPLVPVVHAAIDGRADELDTILSANAVAKALTRQGFRSEVIGIGTDFEQLDALKRRKPLAVFNLVEAIEADCKLAWLAAARLERKGLAITGASARALKATVSKLEMKAVMFASNLPTPLWSDRGFGLPGDERVMVKSVDEHASVGIDSRSIVRGRNAAAEIASREREFGGRFFAEEFIEGREFNISLLEGPGGPRVLPIPEIIFEDFAEGKPRIVDYEAKWDAASHAYHHTPRKFGIELTEPALARELERVSLGVWEAFGIAGYLRVDFRVDSAGKPFVIDINSNPCIAPDAGFAAAAAEAGIGYDALIGQLIEAALVSRHLTARSSRLVTPEAAVAIG